MHAFAFTKQLLLVTHPANMRLILHMGWRINCFWLQINSFAYSLSFILQIQQFCDVFLHLGWRIKNDVGCKSIHLRMFYHSFYKSNYYASYIFIWVYKAIAAVCKSIHLRILFHSFYKSSHYATYSFIWVYKTIAVVCKSIHLAILLHSFTNPIIMQLIHSFGCTQQLRLFANPFICEYSFIHSLTSNN
jgi:hypothetical protein